ncbi:MAG: hypothetical protein OEL53_05890 [Rhodospirillales bacterium]|nr:hypothetical protein [Rhodospirillales bacterium]
MFRQEEPVRFSRSRLWEIKKQYYQLLGQSAWEKKLVPNTISTNAFMALSYAKVLAAYLTDIVLGRAGGADASRPLYIIEIGAGTGRLGYLTAKFLSELAAPLAWRKKGPLFRYVLTDAVSANLDAWRRHPLIAEAMRSGLMDLALFDPASDEGLTLQFEGEDLETVNGGNPLALVANYVFDVLPYDAFTVSGGRLFEHRVGIELDDEPQDVAGLTLETMKRLAFVEQGYPIGLPYYGDEALDAVLDDYIQALPDQLFTMPFGALSCMQRLSKMGGGRLLTLVSDKAHFQLSQFTRKTSLGLSLEGNYAPSVNLEAVARVVARLGGWALSRPAPNKRFDSYAFLLAPSVESMGSTRNAVQEHLLGFGPQAYFALLAHLRRMGDKADLAALLALLSMGRPDPAILLRLSEPLLAATKDVAKVGESERQELLYCLRQAWENRFDQKEESGCAFLMARLAKRLNDSELAAKLYLASLDAGGPDAATYYNLALCLIEMGSPDDAKAFLLQALAIKPDHAPSKEQLARLEPSTH